MHELLNDLKKQYEAKRPFVVYALPGTHEVEACFQRDDTAHVLEGNSDPGFAFHPFHPTETAYYIPKAAAACYSTELKLDVIVPTPQQWEKYPNEQEQYEEMVNKAIQWIVHKKTLKIVTSRKHILKLKKLDIGMLFERLFILYPTAFRYIWYHPKTGMWCGASPELLLESDGNCFKTMALAGTRAPDSFGRVLWTEKEREEQQFVVDDIASKLQKVLTVIKISKTVNHKAGTVVHLRTDISGCVKKGKNSLYDIVQSLHPTPAVCGCPAEKALNFIKTFEGYDREFYTGFMGPMGKSDQDTSLYVNLRCMKIDQGMAHIYVGGGITRGSDPHQEWLETENKLQTMLQVVRPML